MNHKHQQLKNVIDYSERMLKEAESGNWKNVFSLEKLRSELIKKVYSSPSSPDEREDNNNQILQVLVLNKQIEAITSGVRDGVREQIGSASKGRQVIDAYAQNAG